MMLYFGSEGEAMDNHFKMAYGCHMPDINLIPDNSLHGLFKIFFIV